MYKHKKKIEDIEKIKELELPVGPEASGLRENGGDEKINDDYRGHVTTSRGEL